jgi:anthranilate/para-aminobenzoate synthase component I
MFFLQFGGYQILGSSPEILVGVENGVAKIRPLAGTRKRYASDKTESQIMEELLSDEKERAEHVMLVDLARNDLGRVCEWGSVSVNELMVIEKYRHVMHIVSDVTGVLKPECDSVDAFQYGFPAGTVSGTPKVRAMEIISELEPVSRQFYAGGVVFFDFYDNLKSTLVIRSIAIQDGVAYTQAAAGIVADSIPEMEYFETQNKMRSALQAMSLKEPR